MNVGVLITLGTIRVALVCYVITAALLLAGKRGEKWRGILRSTWTLGCIAFVAHVMAAFHFYHHWDHQHAILDTARQTQELMGWAFGEGIYFSYLFLVLWVVDVLWWWAAPAHYEQRPRWWSGAFHLYLFFIAFNGAVVFEAGVTRVGGILATLLFLGIAWRSRRRNLSAASSEANSTALSSPELRHSS